MEQIYYFTLGVKMGAKAQVNKTLMTQLAPSSHIISSLYFLSHSKHHIS